jgi:anti-sigma factor RsiW
MNPRRDLHRAVDGELSKRDTRRLEANPQAKAELERLKAIADAARDVGVGPAPAPTGFNKKVLDELRKRKPH